MYRGRATRVTTFDRSQFLDRLSQAETMYGRVIGFDIAAKKMYLEMGGSSHDEGRAGGGAMNYRTVYFDDRTNYDQLRALEPGDDVTIQAIEETSPTNPYGTGRKLVREVTVIRGNEKLAGFRWTRTAPESGDRAWELSRTVARRLVALVVLCFQERSIPVSPARSVNIPVPLPAGSANRSQDVFNAVGQQIRLRDGHHQAKLDQGLAVSRDAFREGVRRGSEKLPLFFAFTMRSHMVRCLRGCRLLGRICVQLVCGEQTRLLRRRETWPKMERETRH